MKIVKRKIASTEDGESELHNDNGKRPNTANNEGKKRIKTKSWFRQPTVNELNRLQETENLFNSNLFRLQVEEVLQEVKVKEKTEKKIQQWFMEFKNHLISIPVQETEYDLSEQVLVKHLKVKLPINNRLKDTKCMFRFIKFNDVEIVGSYGLGNAINSKLRVDVQITVPSETYTKNDSINYRYHKKRAAYLAFIASHLKESNIIDDLKYTWLNGSEVKPVLDLKPSGKLGNFVCVRINLTCESEAYKLHRFSPLRNNLRESWLFDSNDGNTEIGPPTPYYNSSILSDLTSSTNEEYLKEILLKSENLKQAIVLLKIWLRQRKLLVSGHIVSLLVAYLVQNKRINNIMSSYQIVRNVWISIKTSEWNTKGISLHKGADSPPIEEFHQHFPVVFLDRTGYYNICWQMCQGTYDALRRESSLAVEMLDNPKINSFIPLFMTPVTPLLQFDQILRFKNLQNVKQSIIAKVAKHTQVNYGLDELALVTITLHRLLAKGLGDRVDLILQLVEADFSWPVKKTPEKAKKDGYEEKLSFGFILNAENCVNIVDKGPPANLPEAEEFRAFWGEKSELRRFQDGAITEACVWNGDSLAERRTVSRQIVDYLMDSKYDIKPTDLFHICDQLDTLTNRKQYADAECAQCSLETLIAFDELRRDLRQLKNLPLDVNAVYGVSPVFSYSDPMPPLPRGVAPNSYRRSSAALVKETSRPDGSHVFPEYTPVSRAVLELGHSGKWPGDIEAFRCLKAAFHLQISNQLNKQYFIPTQAYPTHVDVLKNGLVFRLEIAHPKEITLLKREMEKGVVKFKESEESMRLQCDTVLMPRLRGALHGLHQKHPAFGPTACLFKRWLSAHLLSPPHFPSEVAELLTASVFVHSAPLLPPTLPTVGFARVLRLLSETDWTTEMIVLDFNEDMKREEITELERQFSTREEQTPRINIVTAYDGTLPGVWSHGAPTPPVIARARALASSTLQYFQKTLLDEYKDNILSAFVPSLSGYDATIRLLPDAAPYSLELVSAAPLARPLQRPTSVADLIPVVEFDPVRRYLQELRSAYSDYALFFHDSYGGEVIAVLWKPDINEIRDFQLLNANALKPVTVDGETKYKINIQALIEDFRILGAGLVSDVTVI